MGLGCSACRQTVTKELLIEGTVEKCQEFDLWQKDGFVSAYHRQEENFFVKKPQRDEFEQITHVDFKSWKQDSS